MECPPKFFLGTLDSKPRGTCSTNESQGKTQSGHLLRPVWSITDPLSLLLFHKIHCGAVSIDKVVYLNKNKRPKT